MSKKLNKWTYLFLPIVLIFPIVGIIGFFIFGDSIVIIPLSCSFSLPAFTLGIKPLLTKENFICAKDMVIVCLAPIPTSIVLFICVFISSVGYVSLLAIMLGVVFALLTSSSDIVRVIKLYRWWINPSKKSVEGR